MNTQNNNSGPDLETVGTAALAAVSKTPFRTAFSITLGIGLAHLALFAGFIAIISTIVVTLFKILK